MSLDNRFRVTAGARLRMLARNRDLALLLGANLVSQTGDWMLATGVAFQIYVLTGSTLASAAVLLATQLPHVVFGSVAGVLVDRWDRRRVMIVVNLALAATLAPLMLVTRADQAWIVYAVVAVSSCLAPFFVAAEATMLPALVEDHILVTANALNAQVRNVARLVGAAAGGLIVAGGGLALLAVADIATFVLAAILIRCIRHRGTRVETSGPHLIRDWTDGLRAVGRSRALLVVIGFFALSGIGEAIMGTLFAPFVHDVLGGSARTYGIILAAQAVGGIVGGLVVAAFGHRWTPRALFGWGAVAFGALDLALFLYPLLPHAGEQAAAWPAVVIIGLVGLPGAALSAGVLTVFQLATTDRLRGRVFGTVTTVQNATMLLSTLAAGALAAELGIVAVISAQGALYVVAGVGVLALLGPGRSTRRRRSTRSGDSPADDATGRGAEGSVAPTHQVPA